MYKKFLAFAMALCMVFSCESQAMQNQQALEYQKRILWGIGSAMGMGLVSKMVNSPIGSSIATHANYTTDEVNLLTSVAGGLSFVRIFDDSPMTRRWTAALALTTVVHKLWSSYWMQDLLNLGAGTLGQSLFPEKDIEYNKEQYQLFKSYSYELKHGKFGIIEKYDLKTKFVEDYSYRKRSGLAVAVMTVAVVAPMLELFYFGCQKYLHVNMGL